LASPNQIFNDSYSTVMRPRPKQGQSEVTNAVRLPVQAECQFGYSEDAALYLQVKQFLSKYK